LLKYGDDLYGLRESLEQIGDRRQKPRIVTMQVVMGLFFMLLSRIGSLNGIEEAMRKCPRRSRWHLWMGGDLRDVLHLHYELRRRKKTIKPLPGGLTVLLLDGHESFSSYLKECPDCLRRKVHFADEERIQYYHRYVMAYLLFEGGRLLLDIELQRRGEGEIAAATRLFKRVVRMYPRAFNIVAGDALYLDPALCIIVLKHNKEFIAVLKNENRDLIEDFRSLLDEVSPVQLEYARKQCICHDIEGFNTWTQLGHDVRVVRSLETSTVRRQRTKQEELRTTEWLWATSLSRQKASTRTIVRIGHGRWDIENHAFNELANQWHADHLYYHHTNAIVVILLLRARPQTRPT